MILWDQGCCSAKCKDCCNDIPQSCIYEKYVCMVQKHAGRHTQEHKHLPRGQGKQMALVHMYTQLTLAGPILHSHLGAVAPDVLARGLEAHVGWLEVAMHHSIGMQVRQPLCTCAYIWVLPVCHLHQCHSAQLDRTNHVRDCAAVVTKPMHKQSCVLAAAKRWAFATS